MRVTWKGTFEAEWERQPDGSWLILRMTTNPPPFTPPDAGRAMTAAP